MASLPSERTELQERVQRMTEEVERLKSDLKHTTSVLAQVESREDEVRSSLTAVEGELREVRGELRVVQNYLVETRDGLQSAQYELQMVREELITSRGELRESQEELRAVNDNLCDKVAQLDVARREASEVRALLDVTCRKASEAINSAERLNEECRGLRGDLHQQITLVAQMDEVIGRLRDQASAQWASRWLAFQQKAVNIYSDLDFNFDPPSFLILQRSATFRACSPARHRSRSGSTTPTRSSPVSVEKRHHQNLIGRPQNNETNQR